MNEMKVLQVLISAILLAICSQKYSPQNILVKKYHTNVKTKSVPLNSVQKKAFMFSWYSFVIAENPLVVSHYLALIETDDLTLGSRKKGLYQSP